MKRRKERIVDDAEVREAIVEEADLSYCVQAA